jgi:hypothetical protein
VLKITLDDVVHGTVGPKHPIVVENFCEDSLRSGFSIG